MNKIPKYFIKLDNLQAFKEAVASEMDDAPAGSMLGKRSSNDD